MNVDLQCINAVLGINIFGLDWDNLEEGVSPEIEVLKRMISYFGPLPLGLLEHVNQDEWCLAMVQLRGSFNKDNPRQPFSLWSEQSFQNLDSDFKRLVGKMMDLDPAKRATVKELLEDSWWYS